jgi:hypothetical protein
MSMCPRYRNKAAQLTLIQGHLQVGRFNEQGTNAGTSQQTRENIQEHVQSKEPKEKLKVLDECTFFTWP